MNSEREKASRTGPNEMGGYSLRKLFNYLSGFSSVQAMKIGALKYSEAELSQ